MLVTIALLVIATSILIFFDEEFTGMLHKLFAINGVMLFFPLFVASWLVYNFDYFTLWLSYCCRNALENILNILIGIMPVSVATPSIALVIILTLLSMLPVLLIDLFLRKKNPLGYQYPYLTSTIILIISSILLIVL